MASYRMILLDQGKIVGRISLDCADDLAALDEARRLSHGPAVEVWLGERLVARVKPDDRPLDVTDRQSG